MAQEKKRYYFDWAATALPHKNILNNVINPNLNNILANPSSQHFEGREAKHALEMAREKCANVLGVKPDTLYFTSGGTESNGIILSSLIIKNVMKQNKGRILYSAVEHPSIRENCLMLERLGFPLNIIPVEKDGCINPQSLENLIQKNPDTRFAAIMAVNNETGAIMDMDTLCKTIRQNQKAPIHVHCDLVQALGKTQVNIKAWDLDSASVSAHKLGGPRGIGLLYLKKPVEVLLKGGQESGIRPGTENTYGAIALSELIERLASPEMVQNESQKATERFGHLIRSLKAMERCSLLPEDRMEKDKRFSPWILQLRFFGIPGEVMLRALDKEGFAVSTGSACSSAAQERPVLAAMGLDEKARLEGIRISQGICTTMEEVYALLKAIEKVLEFL